ncbi:SAM-dependent methyltransferase [Altererythrobacter sp. B11]|uniref:DUF938 domain-containing protein n=1 Tax=Altererythrobacter sp. B11 TaxID=2060312 RepID=UPI000DC6E378|nr:DUF938 domain-containing protein [Altererythrobacter sp. B11]BBC73721.1 SAM-dependent methyltransferase [Altererythrobacter sp. B11]
MKRSAPAALRNREPIADILAEELPAEGLVLEIASGTGEHAVHFAGRFRALRWQPTDLDAAARQSIAAWREERGLPNLLPPLALDAAAPEWPVEHADALVCINMVHISPPESAEGLMRGAARLLPPGAPLILYGPYLEPGVETAPSNLEFDRSLKARDPRWGLRSTEWMDNLAAEAGMARSRRAALPANNIMLIYRRR